MTNLITKYRPKSFDEVLGQSATVKSLKEICKKKDARIFLFTGPAGTGKTTLARIVAKAYGCEDTNSSILEIDAATFTGIESMRNVQELMRYRPFGGSGQRAIILDEAHGLSKQAYDSLLKTLEEPPSHITWFFCTTNPTKIPQTLKSRCAQFQLKPVNDSDLLALLDEVCQKEKMGLLSDDIANMLVAEAKGSPRQLLSNLVVARTAKNKKEAADLIKAAIETEPAIELAKFIASSNGSWAKVMGFVKKLEEDQENPESIRYTVVNYLTGCLKRAQNDKDAIHFLQKLDAFSQSYDMNAGFGLLTISLGRALFTE